MRQYINCLQNKYGHLTDIRYKRQPPYQNAPAAPAATPDHPGGRDGLGL